MIFVPARKKFMTRAMYGMKVARYRSRHQALKQPEQKLGKLTE